MTQDKLRESGASLRDRAVVNGAGQAVSALRASVPSAVKVVTQREVIRGVPDAWRKTYGRGHYATDAGKQAIQRLLDGLDVETCTPNDIALIIGNRSWTDSACEVCGEQDCDIIARIGEEPEYEARWQDVCLPCLANLGTLAAQAIEARRAETGEDTVSARESAVGNADAPKESGNG